MNLRNNQEECVNSSTQSCSGASPTPADVLLHLAVAAVIFLTVSGNLLVIISICHFKQLHTPTNFLLLSLAVADFFVGMIPMPFHFVRLQNPNWCPGEIYCTIYYLASCHLTCVSIYNVAFIAVDRYLALSNPFVYCTKITLNLTMGILSILWLCSFIYNVALFYSNRNISDMIENVKCAECNLMSNEIWTIFDFIIVCDVPCMTIIIMYLKVFAIAKRHANKINCARQQHTTGSKLKAFSRASEWKAAKTLGILVAVFLLCLLPFYISAFLTVHIWNPSVYLVAVNTMTLMYLNSTINPIIYALFYPWFQKSIKLILTLRICTSQSSLMDVFVKRKYAMDLYSVSHNNMEYNCHN